MEISQEILSQITVYNKYARHLPELNRRETWGEIVERNKQLHIRKFPELADVITEAYNDYVLPKKVLPSMRSMQFAGPAVEVNNARLYNCSFAPVDNVAVFQEVMFLLLSGCGVGYSVQDRHVGLLPVVKGPLERRRRYLIADSLEGWADSVKVLMKSYFEGTSDIDFDFRAIREKGALLITSGGKAPGPDPLRICIDKIRAVLNTRLEQQLRPIDVHDILCHIADAVLSGGIRRAAMIALFDKTDYDMLSCKSGAWWELNPQRGRANNSVILNRAATTEDEFFHVWGMTKASGAGEPGFSWTNDEDWGFNPCHEVSLKPFQFCNLTTINVSDVITQYELNARARVAAFIGTLQASYTDFHYLRPIWKETTETDALIGVSMTGIASGGVFKLDLKEAAINVRVCNFATAQKIKINTAARTTTVKPEGTASLVCGTSSGIHAWHNEYYIRRMRVGKNEALYAYMRDNLPELVEDCVYKPHIEAVMSFPQKAPCDAVLRAEPASQLLARVSMFNTEWILAGHHDGANVNNVSCTVSLQDDEWGLVGKWMWDNRNLYSGISVLPYDGGSYVQAPFEDCTKEEYERLLAYMHDIDLAAVVEQQDTTTLAEQAACSGGVCEIA